GRASGLCGLSTRRRGVPGCIARMEPSRCSARTTPSTARTCSPASAVPWRICGKPYELGREDSNLQLPKLRRRRAQRRPKQDKHLSDPSNVKQAPAKQKIDPETVTKPSSGSAPRKRI